jgi:hypothetical protein
MLIHRDGSQLALANIRKQGTKHETNLVNICIGLKYVGGLRFIMAECGVDIPVAQRFAWYRQTPIGPRISNSSHPVPSFIEFETAEQPIWIDFGILGQDENEDSSFHSSENIDTEIDVDPISKVMPASHH